MSLHFCFYFQLRIEEVGGASLDCRRIIQQLYHISNPQVVELMDGSLEILRNGELVLSLPNQSCGNLIHRSTIGTTSTPPPNTTPTYPKSTVFEILSGKYLNIIFGTSIAYQLYNSFSPGKIWGVSYFWVKKDDLIEFTVRVKRGKGEIFSHKRVQ